MSDAYTYIQSLHEQMMKVNEEETTVAQKVETADRTFTSLLRFMDNPLPPPKNKELRESMGKLWAELAQMVVLTWNKCNCVKEREKQIHYLLN